jgi:hypothetical protein
MASRTGRRAAGGRGWKRLAVAFVLLPLVGLWVYGIVGSVAQIRELLDGPRVEPAPALAATSDRLSNRLESSATAPADPAPAQAAPDDTAPRIAGVRPLAQADDADVVPELRSTGDILPLFAEYLQEADAEQTRQIVETLAEFLPP